MLARSTSDTSAPESSQERPDYRLAGPALAAWAGSAVGVGISPGWAIGAGTALVALGAWSTRRSCYLSAVILLAAAAATIVAGLRVLDVASGPVAALAQQRAVVRLHLEPTSDPVVRHGTFEDIVVVRARVESISGRGLSARVHTPVLVIADLSWRRVLLGSQLDTVGSLAPADGSDIAAVFFPTRIDAVTAAPSWWWRASGVLRAGITEGVAHSAPAPRALVPALVDGDESAIPTAMADAFRTCGLTHLLAVSGTNLTLVVGFVLLISRWCGIRGYAQITVGLVGTAGFVLLARPDPSVLRAAAMGLVALAGLGAGGRRRGVRALSLAVLVLVLIDPWLARSVGFVLSVFATGGILVLAPRWAARLSTWLPQPLAESLAVPMAAQVACTPVIAAFSGQVSIVAVGANLLAGPAVGPATVLGLLAGLVTVLWQDAGHLLGLAASAPAWWIVTVAQRGAALPGASAGWRTGAVSITVLVGICLAFCLAAPRLLARPRTSAAALMLVAGWALHPVSWGWPPAGWVMVVCDVGQGDALVLNAGPGAAVVVDTGPDPVLVDRCLDRLGVEVIPLVVLTHVHADHVNGLPGVFAGRDVGEVDLGPVVPDDQEVADIQHICAVAGVRLLRTAYASQRQLGDLTLEVLGPVPGVATPGLSGSDRNNSSVVLAVSTEGVRLLLSGDVEPEAQQALLGWGPELRADVLKVPHHGSRYQEPRFLAAVDARLSVISVGADNTYGQPAPETLDTLRRDGAEVLRTDESGDVAVVVHDGHLLVASR